MLLSVAVAGGLGLIVGLPALHVRGTQLAVVTLATAVVIERVILRNPNLSPPEGNPIPAPRLFGIDLAVRRGTDLARLPFGILVIVALLLIGLAVCNLTRGASGRAFLAVRSNERAASGAGIDVARTNSSPS